MNVVETSGWAKGLQVAMGSAYGDPLNAIRGLLADLCSFLEADIPTVRSGGIDSVPEPLKLVDPKMEHV
ncbi:MAG: hypothetical protein ACKPKO_42025, partial [Candidatus Fonsibacter sp.]